MSEAAEGDARNPEIPLCFDTSAVWSKHVHKDLRKIRAAFPARALFLPIIVVAERARQLRLDLRDGFNWWQVRNFLDDTYLRLKVVDFDQGTVVPAPVDPARQPPSSIPDGAWLQVVQGFDEVTWKRLERARFADHAVYAIARATRSILVTNDGGLLDQAQKDAYRPGTVKMDRLLRIVGDTLDGR